MRRLFRLDGPLPPLFLPLLGAIIVLAAARGPVHAQEKTAEPPKTRTYVVPATEGYGINDCFKQGSTCGQIVASSWCESRGHGKPAAWGSADDVTATVPVGTKAPAKGALLITCNE